MKIILLITFGLSFIQGYSQLEITTGYAVNRNYADGPAVHVAYDFNIKGRWFTKSQLGFKSLFYYNDFVGATMKVRTWELHQTFSYELVKKGRYVLKPNIGINYRFYKWKAQMKEPLNMLPIRSWVIGVRKGNFSISSTSGDDYREYTPDNFGFSIQLQNQFKLNDRIWLHITPFIEPDYDRSQNTGGCYVGVILKKL